MTDERVALTRRAILAAVAAIGPGFALARSGCAAPKEAVGAQPRAKVCILTPEAMEGPFYFDPKLVRSDITEGKPGAQRF